MFRLDNIPSFALAWCFWVVFVPNAFWKEACCLPWHRDGQKWNIVQYDYYK